MIDKQTVKIIDLLGRNAFFSILLEKSKRQFFNVH